jgi:hypothetical protein
VTAGGLDKTGVFHEIARIDDARLSELFAREVLAMLVAKGLLSIEWAERILSWPHSSFNIHSLVRAKTKPEAERPPPPHIAYQEHLIAAEAPADYFS